MDLVSIDRNRLREVNAAALVDASDDLHGRKFVTRVVREVSPDISQQLDAREHLVVRMMRNNRVLQRPYLKLNRVGAGLSRAVNDLARERWIALVRARHLRNDVGWFHLFSHG